MWLIIFMIAIVLPLIIWGFIANRNENKFVDEASNTTG